MSDTETSVFTNTPGTDPNEFDTGTGGFDIGSTASTTGADFAGSGAANSGSTAQGGESGLQTPLVDQAKQQAQKVVEQTQQKAGEVLDQAKDRTKSWAEGRKAAAAEHLSGVALAVMQTGESLRGNGNDAFGAYAAITDQAAGAVDKASAYLRDTSVDQMIGEVENFGKREPVLFLVGAAALGFLAARFLKSSGRSAGSAQYNPDRTLPVPIDTQDSGMGMNYDTTSAAG